MNKYIKFSELTNNAQISNIIKLICEFGTSRYLSGRTVYDKTTDCLKYDHEAFVTFKKIISELEKHAA